MAPASHPFSAIIIVRQCSRELLFPLDQCNEILSLETIDKTRVNANQALSIFHIEHTHL